MSTSSGGRAAGGGGTGSGAIASGSSRYTAGARTASSTAPVPSSSTSGLIGGSWSRLHCGQMFADVSIELPQLKQSPNSRLRPFTWAAKRHSWWVVGPRTTDRARTRPLRTNVSSVSKRIPGAAGFRACRTYHGPMRALVALRASGVLSIAQRGHGAGDRSPTAPQNGHTCLPSRPRNTSCCERAASAGVPAPMLAPCSVSAFGCAVNSVTRLIPTTSGPLAGHAPSLARLGRGTRVTPPLVPRRNARRRTPCAIRRAGLSGSRAGGPRACCGHYSHYPAEVHEKPKSSRKDEGRNVR
ncbi:MAG: hypothetical protein AVDCRST_MAG64-423 [uncultured Phycisphaerae bacterium]|uniref:Uncharacterized protein n=1 Tax=uncultured Phycisphaerae bacterium TaxID=904963 RepID=A0A6J4N9P3_9BACT|nr:MAG: hypothetical protein AVDCRST_MAG64-423 [uncultured Phycisphaerae bacterium]